MGESKIGGDEIRKVLKNVPKPKCPICGAPLILTTNVWGEIIGICPTHGTAAKRGENKNG